MRRSYLLLLGLAVSCSGELSVDAGEGPTEGAATAEVLQSPSAAAKGVGPMAAEGGIAAEPSGAEGWSIYRGDASMTGRAAGTLPEAPVLLWSFDAGDDILSSPVLADGRVYFGCDDMQLHCLDAETGEELWSYATEDIIEAPPLVVDGKVYVGSTDCFFYALDAETGELRWRKETEDSVQAGANFERTADGLRITFASYDNRLFCLDGETGEELWVYDMENRVNGTPAILDGKAYFAGCDTIMHEVSMESGKALSQVELGSDGQVTSSLALADGRAYFGIQGAQFLCIDLATGEPVWKYEGRKEFLSSAAVSGERVVIGSKDRMLHCVDRQTGEKLWTFAARKAIDASPVIVGDKVLFGSLDGRIYIVGLEDGKELWSHDFGKALMASPAVSNGRFFVGGTDGFLHAFGPGGAGAR